MGPTPRSPCSSAWWRSPSTGAWRSGRAVLPGLFGDSAASTPTSCTRSESGATGADDTSFGHAAAGLVPARAQRGARGEPPRRVVVVARERQRRIEGGCPGAALRPSRAVTQGGTAGCAPPGGISSHSTAATAAYGKLCPSRRHFSPLDRGYGGVREVVVPPAGQFFPHEVLTGLQRKKCAPFLPTLPSMSRCRPPATPLRSNPSLDERLPSPGHAAPFDSCPR
jgi:hypothetical protein